MRHKQLLALFLCFVMIFSSKIVSSQNDNIVKVKDVVSNVDKYTIESIVKDDEKQSVNIYYPVTEYENVNAKINEKIKEYMTNFENSNYITDKKQLTISFDTFEFKEYNSFKFNIKSNVGITHDLDEVFTIVYKKDKIILITDLKDNIVEKLYEECKSKLKSNEKIIEFSNDKWIDEGLVKDSNTFSNYIISDNSIVLYFNPCTVAPYAAGIIQIEIPYDNLQLCLE